MIRTITERARAMIIDSQAPVQFWEEAVKTALCHHQKSQDEGLERNIRDSYQPQFEMPYEILHGCGKPMHDADGNNVSYQASLHSLCRLR